MHFASTIMTLAAQRKGIIHVRVATATTRRSGSPFTGQLLEARDSILEKRVRETGGSERSAAALVCFVSHGISSVCVCVMIPSAERLLQIN